jgi:8-oxo-dGTP pyrophosphatase MutT (NUDIX family)
MGGCERRRAPAGSGVAALKHGEPLFEDTRVDRLESALRSHAWQRIEPAAGFAEAGVAIVVRAAEPLEVLFIRRTDRPGDPWSGHVAFPGGRRSVEDTDIRATALRETEEETGLAVARVGRVIGRLDDLATSHRLPRVVISPFVVAIPPSIEAQPDPREVLTAAWVPMPALRDAGAVSELFIERDGGRLRFPSLIWQDYVIWGLTHRILGQFLEVAAGAGL